MILRLVILLFLLAGISCLLLSLIQTRKICLLERKYYLSCRWLSLLVIALLAGYTYYYLLLIHREVNLFDLLPSIILGGAGAFVIIVVRLNLHTLLVLKQKAEEERHRALHDNLTDLPNRTLLYERIEHAMLHAQRNKEHIAVLLMDLNRFKEINDTLGHFYGDYLLQMIAPRLWKSIRKSDTIARFGGDEFAVILPGVDLPHAISITEKITAGMEEPFLVEGNLLSIDVSIGIAMYPEHGADSDTLLQRADVALYAAKKKANANYAVYNSEYDEYSMERLILIAELRDAIKKDRLFLHYQPKYSLADRRICGVEALVRWQRESRKRLMLPDTFVPVAEKTGLIRTMTYQIFEKVFAQSSRWKADGLLLPISVNLSTKMLHDLDLPGKIQEIIEKWQIDPGTITVEITESSMMVDPELAFQVISGLGRLGLQLSIDDFGTGYSSLALLKRLPGCELKIDKTFVLDMIKDSKDFTIVQTSINLARNMNLKVVAEGVETRETLEKLIEMGCEMAQGYYLCKPLPPDELQQMIKGESAEEQSLMIPEQLAISMN